MNSLVLVWIPALSTSLLSPLSNGVILGLMAVPPGVTHSWKQPKEMVLGMRKLPADILLHGMGQTRLTYSFLALVWCSFETPFYG